MATLVLTAVGTIFGGPIGGMIGAMAGQYIDQNILFKPKTVHGPRLTDLAVQTSSYGTQIPRLYGRMRVAGTVIWATPLKESRKKHKAKGQPDQVTYSYSASFAVAVSSRAIAGVGRIWADGTLIRSAGGRFTLDTGFRVHLGTPDQPHDPLIASAEGMNATPAHRDLAYVVFENLPLADFGNRIPSLSFELIADATPLSGQAILADMMPGLAEAAPGGFTPDGYAASGTSVRQAAAPLIEAAGVTLVGGYLADETAPFTLPDDAPAAIDGDPWPERKRDPEATLPASIAVRHYDPARDWLIGLERTGVVGSAGGREALVDCPMALGRPVAQALATRTALRMVEAQEGMTLPLGPMAFGLVPGMLVRLANTTGLWRVSQWQWGAHGAELRLVRHAADRSWPMNEVLPPVDDDGPRALHAALFDLPGWSVSGAESGALLALAQASEKGGGAVEVGIQMAGSSEAVPVARALDVPVLGFAENVLGLGSAALFAGANAAMVGGELIQFGRADAMAPDMDGKPRYRLSHLLRGRGGTEDQISQHAVGDAFALLDDGAGALALTLLLDKIGLQPVGPESTITPRRPGSEVMVALQPPSIGRTLMPLSPVHLEARFKDAGGLSIQWVRRSRTGWLWADGVDAPLEEPVEAYQVDILSDAGSSRTFDSPSPRLDLDAATLAPLTSGGTTRLTISVRQRGQQNVSPPANLVVPLS